MLEMGSIVPCNALRYNLGLDQNWLFDTESLIWQRVPESAILASITFHKLRTSSFAAMFPACFVTPIGGHKRGLAEIRSELCSADHDGVSCNPHALVRVILQDLGLSADHIVCDQLAVILYGWKLGHSGPKNLSTLDEKILVGCKDFIEETQHRLYCASVLEKLARQTECLTDALNKDAVILENTVKKFSQKIWIHSRREPLGGPLRKIDFLQKRNIMNQQYKLFLRIVGWFIQKGKQKSSKTVRAHIPKDRSR
jgi:hypothetical protein